MTKVIGVRFRNVGKLYYFDPADLNIKNGDRVIVETARGEECGFAALGVHEVEDGKIVKPFKKVVRIASAEDVAQYNANRLKERDAHRICQKKIREHKLDMKLVDVEYAFDGQKILFYFTAEGRVDFRDLVKDLASVFRTRIELRQIGVRDESKLLGGLGMCGKPFCCSTFLFDFQPVSIKMAKEQGKSLNPTKISGTCGRLMCCLKYEQEVYEDLIRNSPKNGTPVQTPDGPGFVVDNSLLTGTVKVRLTDKQDQMPKTYPLDAIGWSGPKPKPQPPQRGEQSAKREKTAKPAVDDMPLPEGALYAQIELPAAAGEGGRKPKQDGQPRQDKPSRPPKKKDNQPAQKADKPANADAPADDAPQGEAKAKRRRPRRRPRGKKPKTGEGGQTGGGDQPGPSNDPA